MALKDYLVGPDYPKYPGVTPFEETESGKLFSKLSETGTYSPLTKRSILRTAGMTGAGEASKIRSGTRGELFSRGLQGSVAGVRALAEPGIAHGRNLLGLSGDIERQNEASKLRALEMFGKGIDTTEERRRAAEYQNRQADYQDRLRDRV